VGARVAMYGERRVSDRTDMKTLSNAVGDKRRARCATRVDKFRVARVWLKSGSADMD